MKRSLRRRLVPVPKYTARVQFRQVSNLPELVHNTNIRDSFFGFLFRIKEMNSLRRHAWKKQKRIEVIHKI